MLHKYFQFSAFNTLALGTCTLCFYLKIHRLFYALIFLFVFLNYSLKSVSSFKLKMVKEFTETFCLNISITILLQVSYETFATDLKNLLKQVCHGQAPV